jgi:hypothetical protein
LVEMMVEIIGDAEAVAPSKGMDGWMDGWMDGCVLWGRWLDPSRRATIHPTGIHA